MGKRTIVLGLAAVLVTALVSTVGVPPASAAEIGEPIITDSFPLYGVDCPTPTTCIAVSTSNEGPFSEVVVITDGVPGPAQPSGGSLTDVACVDATTCYAVGGNRVLTITNGVPGTAQTVEGVNLLTGVTCVDATTCYVVGTSTAAGVVIPIVNGVLGEPLPIPNTPQHDFFAIDCSSPTDCYIVGFAFSFATFGYNSVLIPFIDGTFGQAQPLGSGQVQAIACSDASTCYVLKDFGELIPVVNGVAGTPTPFETAVFGLQCANATTCYGVGRNDEGASVIPIVNGVPQAMQTVPGTDPGGLYDVACGSATTCEAVGYFGTLNQGLVVSITGDAPDAPASLVCETRTNNAGTLINVCTVSDPVGIRSVVVRNTDTGVAQSGLSFGCTDAPTSAKFRVPAGSRYRVVVTDCSDARNKTTFVIRPNGTVSQVSP